MAADWLKLPSDLLVLIAQRSRDAVTGLAAFRSVCRTWRAAVGPAPRLLLPRAGSDSEPEHALVFPLTRGWSVAVDARDASCHLSHLPTGATAALPSLNVVRDGISGAVTHLRYVDCNDAETAIASYWIFTNYLEFTDFLRFAVHVPPGTPPAAAGTEGMIIMMSHMMLGRTGMVFCRPGDAAWTKVEKPSPVGYGFFDLAYHDGKMFGLETHGEMAVFDATTLDVVHLVQPPPATPNLANKMYGSIDQHDFDYVHLVALPTKLVLVRTSVRSSRPVGFDIFELAAPDGLAWRKVNDAGNYELFIDGYHATFRENGAKTGTRIYYVHDEHWVSTTAAYSYDMQDNKLECVYRSPENSPECSTKPRWFVP